VAQRPSHKTTGMTRADVTDIQKESHSPRSTNDSIGRVTEHVDAFINGMMDMSVQKATRSSERGLFPLVQMRDSGEGQISLSVNRQVGMPGIMERNKAWGMSVTCFKN